VSPSQFIVFTCRGADDKIMLSSLNFLPMETWEESLGGPLSAARFAYAQQAGRFAFSRTVSGAGTLGPTSPATGAPTGNVNAQEVRVYQAESGDLLFKLNCLPLSPIGQNFDLSTDGMNILLVRDATIEIYNLPPLTAQDKKELAEVQQREPPVPKSPRVRLRHLVQEEAESTSDAPTASSDSHATPPAGTPAPAATAMTTPVAAAPTTSTAASPTANSGDVETHRKPPSLLNPGEPADSAKKPPQL
jgi:hypothetical protein